ncbi:MAG: hypothetical protein J6B55_01660, partial [Clostridia bacterium]|nr:hypothetical protein [Clostridia bacterium]
MKITKKILAGSFALLTLTALLSGCGKPPKKSNDWRPNDMKTTVTSDSLSVKKVENLPEDFIMGMDASCVPALEASGIKYAVGKITDTGEKISAEMIAADAFGVAEDTVFNLGTLVIPFVVCAVCILGAILA